MYNIMRPFFFLSSERIKGIKGSKGRKSPRQPSRSEDKVSEGRATLWQWPQVVFYDPGSSFWFLLVVSKWPFVSSYYLNGCSTEEAPMVWLFLKGACVGNTYFFSPNRDGIEKKQRLEKHVMTVAVGRQHVNSAIVHLLIFQKWVLIEKQISRVFPVFWIR